MRPTTTPVNRLKPGLQRSAFTLLEVVLALSLAAALLGTLSTALYVHLQVVGTTRSQVEEAQLARTILRRIADDVRSAVRQPSKDAEWQDVFSSTGSSDAQSALSQGATGSSTSGGSSPSGSSGTSGSQSDDAQATLDMSAPHTIAGLYGNQYELQVDISRLPRPDELGPLTADPTQPPLAIVPHDVRTVAYYVRQGGVAGEIAGLVRREMGRAAAVWASEQGDYTAAQASEVLLAPEVVGLELLYFDGTEWFPDWDTELNGALPMAVEIRLFMLPADQQRARTAATSANANQTPLRDESTASVYRLLVNLPNAEPSTSSAAAPTEGMEEEL
jgi:hypothetical protein